MGGGGGREGEGGGGGGGGSDTAFDHGEDERNGGKEKSPLDNIYLKAIFATSLLTLTKILPAVRTSTGITTVLLAEQILFAPSIHKNPVKQHLDNDFLPFSLHTLVFVCACVRERDRSKESVPVIYKNTSTD